jgi:hypothetical protein
MHKRTNVWVLLYLYTILLYLKGVLANFPQQIYIYWRVKELSNMGRELATVTRTEARQYIESMS